MLFHHRPLRYDDFWPDPGPGVDDRTAFQDDVRADDRIVLDVAPAADERIVIDDAPADGAVPPDHHPVVDGRGEDLRAVLDDASFPDARVRPDDDVLLDDRPCAYRDRPDHPGVRCNRDAAPYLRRPQDPGALDIEVAGYVGEPDLLEFPPLRLPERPRAPDVGPVAPGKPGLQDMPFLHETGEEVSGKVELLAGRYMVEYLRVADVHAGAREV